jgi:SAM-dependent methyltransferase
MHEVNWDERYQGDAEQRPWDIGSVEAELKRVVENELAGEKISRALEIGCGTGTNAIWLAERGVDVLGTEISPTAIAAANKKVAGKNLPIRFVENDIVQTPPVQPGSIDFAFDRGVFHVMGPQQRGPFVKHVAQSLSEGGWWLCMAGSADETKPADRGPPRLKAAELIAAVEAEFEIHSLRKTFFGLPDGAEFAAWALLLRKRS